MKTPIPGNEYERLKALRQYAILDTPDEKVFDDITFLTSHVCQTPYCLISFVDSERVWFKSKIGLDIKEIPRNVGICAHPIMESEELFIIHDTTLDERFVNNPMVQNEPHIRFYAGAPLVTSDNLVLGVLCVLDSVPRELTKEQMTALRALSRSVVNELDLRRNINILSTSNTDLKRTETELREAEERLRDFLENVNDMIQSVDTDGNFLYVNRTWLNTLGYNRSEMSKLKLMDVLHPDCRDKCVEKFMQVLAGKSLGEVEAEFITKDGKKIIVEGNSNVKFENGKPLYTRSIFRNITDRKRMEKELKLKQAYFEQLFNHAPEAIVVLDNEDRIIDANREFSRMFGYTHEESLGKFINHLIAPFELRGESLMLTGKVAKGEAVSYETVRHRKDGTPLDVSILGTPIIAEWGNNLVYGIYHDITERKRMEKELQIKQPYFVQLFDSSPELRDEALALTDKVAHGEMISFETVRKKKDGSLFDVWILAAPIYVEGGKIALYGMYRDITERKQIEKEREQLIHDLQEALANIKTLRGLIPICAWCKKIRNDTGYWSQVESYIEQQADVKFSHGICPECFTKVKSEFRKE
ncbi:MAG: PAS domain S-box protein [Bacteroidota bacterium]|nr:PAS domain S-box protein [Bacteroidota bacterium]